MCIRDSVSTEPPGSSFVHKFEYPTQHLPLKAAQHVARFLSYEATLGSVGYHCWDKRFIDLKLSFAVDIMRLHDGRKENRVLFAVASYSLELFFLVIICLKNGRKITE